MDGGGESMTAAKEVRGLKKGPWTATEDAILTEYVRKHGEGNWNAVQKNSGLLRCGKSCRLRWANHLRPNLKKGSFSPDEERLIIELHAKHGNKWARMASQLPGRTDNEIKNYWNTRMKRRQRAGLPLYPQEIHQGVDLDVDELVSFGFQSQDHHQNMNPNSSNTSSSSSTFSSSSSKPRKRLCLDPSTSYNPSLNQISDSPMNYSMFSLYNNTFHDHDNNRFGFSLPLSSSSSSSNELCNPNHLLEFNNGNIDVLSYSSLLMGDHYHHHENITPSSFPLQDLELPSNQTTLNTNKNGVFLDPPAANSGLLDALLEESQVLSRGGISKELSVSLNDPYENQDNKRMKIGVENLLIDHLTSSTQSSIGTNPNSHNKNINEATIVNDEIDDEDFLMSLLNNFPASTSLPWRIDSQFDGSNLASPTGIYLGNSLVDSVTVQPSSGVDPMTSLGSCNWSNMPRIC